MIYNNTEIKQVVYDGRSTLVTFSGDDGGLRVAYIGNHELEILARFLGKKCSITVTSYGVISAVGEATISEEGDDDDE